MNLLNLFNQRIAPLLNQQVHNRRQFNFPHISPIIEDDNNLPLMGEEFKQKGVCFDFATSVEYQAGKIVYYPKSNNELGISYEFSGCAMVQFEYANTNYIAHISLSEARSSWNKFIDNIVLSNINKYKNFIMFKPYCVEAKKIYEYNTTNTFPNIGISVCGIIFKNECYAVIMNMNDCTLSFVILMANVERVYGIINAQNYRNLLL